MIVVRLLSAGFSRLLGHRRSRLAAVAGVALHALTARASAGVIRAAIMAGLPVFAVQVGRRSHGLNSLTFAAALMALHDPHILL